MKDIDSYYFMDLTKLASENHSLENHFSSITRLDPLM